MGGEEQSWKILPPAPQLAAGPQQGPGGSGCGAGAAVVLGMTWGLEGTRNAGEGGMALCLPPSSPARCHPHVWVQLFELPEDAGG